MTPQQTETPRGSIDARPAAESVPAGYRFIVTDEHGDHVFVSDGTDWVPDQADEMWTLKYAEDVAAGDHIRNCYKIGQDHLHAGPVVLVRSEGVEVTEYVEVLEARSYDGFGRIACRTLRPNGEQVPLYLQMGELVRVRQEMPS